MEKYDNRCKAFLMHVPCREKANIHNGFTVHCCQHCSKYDSCKKNRCENDPDVCGMYFQVLEAPGRGDEEATVEEVNSKIPKAGQRTGRDFKITQYDPQTGALLGVYKSMQDCEAATGATKVQIQRCCAGIQATAAGYVWRRENVAFPVKRIERQRGVTCCSNCVWFNTEKTMRRKNDLLYKCENPAKKRDVYYKKSGWCKKYKEKENE